MLRNSWSGEPIRLGLARHGMPDAKIQRMMAELEDHWMELEAEGRDQGLADAEAAAQADARLGDPDHLVETMISSARMGSWLGRHPVWALGVFPMLGAPLLMAAGAAVLFFLDNRFGLFRDEAAEFPNGGLVAAAMWTLYYGSAALAPLGLTWWGWRAGLGLRWIASASVFSALMALARGFDVDPAARTITASLNSSWALDVRSGCILVVHLGLVFGFYVSGVWRRKKREREHEGAGWAEEPSEARLGPGGSR